VREIDRCCPARVESEPQGDEIECDCDTEIPLLDAMGPAAEFYTIERASASRMRVVNERAIVSIPVRERVSRRARDVHTDAHQGEHARKKYDKCVALHRIAAGQNRSHDRRPEERATQKTARMAQSRASRFAGPRLCHIRCRIHRDAP
jgi:hypothetical protein